MKVKQSIAPIPLMWIGKDGTEYQYQEFANHKEGVKKWNPYYGKYQTGLPAYNYPYTIIFI